MFPHPRSTMKTPRRLLSGLACAALLVSFAAVAVRADPAWLPAGIPPPPAEGPALTPGDYLPQPVGRAILDAARAEFPDRARWDAYAAHVRTRIQEALTLTPWPRRTPLNAVIRDRRTYDGYTVENVVFESVPGALVTGALYRPTRVQATYPAVLTTHGHSRRIEKPEDYANHARFSPNMQTRAAAFARMGAVVFAIDMVGYGDSIPIVGQEAHRTPFTQTLQVWNAIRAVDFLLDQPGVDPKRIAVTGESGGGTQSFLLTALDPRITASAPVVMVSAHFFGGCPCESGRPIHRSADHFASNAMIAALAAPRPQLLVSDGKDWTLNTPQVEFPFLQHIYGYYGAADRAFNVHLPDEGHDYGPSKRAAVYRFLAAQLGLDLSAVQRADGPIDESAITVEPPDRLHVFGPDHPIPATALRTPAEIEASLRALQR